MEITVSSFYDEWRGSTAWHVKINGTIVAMVWDEKLAYKIKKLLIEADH